MTVETRLKIAKTLKERGVESHPYFDEFEDELKEFAKEAVKEAKKEAKEIKKSKK